MPTFILSEECPHGGISEAVDVNFRATYNRHEITLVEVLLETVVWAISILHLNLGPNVSVQASISTNLQH